MPCPDSQPPTERPVTWALVPVKPLTDAKSRLTRLDPRHRRELGRRLLHDQIARLQELERRGLIGGISVTTRCPEARTLAKRHGADVLDEPADVRQDGAGDQQAERRLNRALTEASRQLLERGVHRLLILPIDTPLASAEDLARFLRSADDPPGVGEAPVVRVATDRHDDGTNALICQPPTAITFRFGPSSAALHIEGDADRRFRDSALAFDLDTDDDLDTLLALPEEHLQAAALHSQALRWLGQLGDLPWSRPPGAAEVESAPPSPPTKSPPNHQLTPEPRGR